MSLDPLIQKLNHSDDQHHRKIYGRSSLDTFLIPGRTRLPSSKTKVPDQFDLRLTRALLSTNSTQMASAPGPRTSTRRGMVSSPNAPLFHQRDSSGTDTWTPAGFDGPGDSTDQSRMTSTTWSTVSHRVFTDSSGSSDHRETSEFVKEYNNLALKHGLPQFVLDLGEAKDRVPSNPSTSSSQEDGKPKAKPHYGWLLRKLLRKSSSSYNIKTKSTKVVARRMSTADMPERGRKDTLKDKSLEEVARLGGVGLLILPPEFAAARLAIPTGLCATAAYLLQHGRTTPGIFRVNGQLSTINKLYDHYAQQFDLAGKVPGNVQQNVGSAFLPNHITYNVHDVASVFKKFLNSLPGGILGSLSLFTALQSINNHHYPSSDMPDNHHRKIRGRLIALAISSVTSQYRISLICAVLGLVAVVGHDAQAASTKTDSEVASAPTTELMGYKGLGLVFAPLVIGELTDEIELRSDRQCSGPLSVPNSPPKRRTNQMRKASGARLAGKCTILDMSGERYKMSAEVMEMLLINWRDVVSQLRYIGAMEGHCTIQEKRRAVVGERSKYSLNVSQDQIRGPPSADWEGSLKVRKKVTIQTSSPGLFGSMQGSNGADSQTRFQSRESLKIGIKGRRQPSAQQLLDAMSANLAYSREESQPVDKSNLLRDTAAVRDTATTSDQTNGCRASESIKWDLPEPVRARMGSQSYKHVPLDRQAIYVNHSGVKMHSAHFATSSGTTGQLETSDHMRSFSNQNQFDKSNSLAINKRIENSAKDIKDEQDAVAFDEDPIPNQSVVSPAIDLERGLEVMKQDLGLDTSADAKGIPAVDASSMATVKAHVETSSTAAENTVSLGATNSNAPRVTRIGSVKKLVERISKSRESSHSHEENQPRMDARIKALTRQRSVKEAAQLLNNVAVPNDDHRKVSARQTSNKHSDPVQCAHDVNNNKTEITWARTRSALKISLIPKPVTSQGNSRSSSPTKVLLNIDEKRVSGPIIMPNGNVPDRKSSRSVSPSKPVVPMPTAAPDTTQRFPPSNGLSDLPLGVSQRLTSSSTDDPNNPDHLSSSRSASFNSNSAATTNATLYAEIRRLKRQLANSQEETVQAHKELEAVRDYRESGALARKLREAERERGMWRGRAEWAEKRLVSLGLGEGRRGVSSASAGRKVSALGAGDGGEGVLGSVAQA